MNIEFRRHSQLAADINIPDPAEGEDYIVPACISSTTVDSHHSRMDLETTLNNFVAEATVGVVTMDSHNHQCGLGNTREGRLKDEQVWADLTVVPDTPLSALASYPNTDIFIKMIRRGKIRDVSIGASGGTWECNICMRDMWRSGRCIHWPGIVYHIDQDDGSVKEITCIAIIKDAHLSEVSFVYSGANPDAKIIENTDLVIQRAKLHADDGHLDQKQLTYLNKRFGAALDIRRANDYSTSILPGGISNTMDLQEALAKINTLETEKATLQSQVTDLTNQNQKLTDDLELANSEIKQEREMLIQQARTHYMDQRKENMSAEDLAAYEKTLAKFNLRELKQEVDKMTIISQAMENDGGEQSITAGQKTQQADSTNGGSVPEPEGPTWLQNIKERNKRAKSK